LSVDCQAGFGGWLAGWVGIKLELMVIFFLDPKHRFTKMLKNVDFKISKLLSIF
jgi:hypothetical protein